MIEFLNFLLKLYSTGFIYGDARFQAFSLSGTGQNKSLLLTISITTKKKGRKNRKKKPSQLSFGVGFSDCEVIESLHLHLTHMFYSQTCPKKKTYFVWTNMWEPEFRGEY